MHDVSPSPNRQPWQADPAVVARFAAKADGFNYDEAAVPPYQLPDLLTTTAGRKIVNAEDWLALRRNELLNLFAHHVYGKAPTFQPQLTFTPTLPSTNTSRTVRITIADGIGNHFSFPAAVHFPSDTTRPVCCFLLINNRPPPATDSPPASSDDFFPIATILSRGFAAAVVNTWDIDPDDSSPAARANGIRGIWPGDNAQGDAWGSIAAWAYGARQTLTWLQTLPEINPAHIALIGHSRAGKAALWASATDPRFALTISNCSGQSGAKLSRRRLGETVARVNTRFRYWFADNYKHFNNREANLPIDQHALLALIAPRPLYIASKTEDLWADPRGEYLALAQASRVFSLFDHAPPLGPDNMPPADTLLRRGNLQYHLGSGPHDLTLADWGRYMNAASKLWGTIWP